MINADLVRRTVSAVLNGESVTQATISIALVDDVAMRELNRRYLNHDYHTDVLSFLLDETDGHLEGEVIVSAAMAIERAAEFKWTAVDELLLYVIHGTLHLTGYDDHSDVDRGRMRRKEMHYLQELGRNPQCADPRGEARIGADDAAAPENLTER